MSRKYYAERSGKEKQLSLSFDELIRSFRHIYSTFEQKFYFQEAVGYTCTDAGRINGLWGADPDTFVMIQLHSNTLWPIEEKSSYYDEIDLFTIIEFLYDYDEWNNCGWHYYEFDKAAGQTEYQVEMNRILGIFGDGFELKQNGEIHRKAPLGLTQVVENPVVTSDPENIDERIKSAVSKYMRHSASIDDKKDAVRTLADVLEYLRNQGVTFCKSDDGTLFQIINKFDIRHHRKDQQGEYDKELFYEWMFFTFLSSINLLVNYRMKTGQEIP
jgi:hypothetical protein